MAISAQDRGAILETIADWPTEDQIQLAGDILLRALRLIEEREGVTFEPIRRSMWEALHSIASNDQEPPTDQQVEQRLDERRMKNAAISAAPPTQRH